MGKKAKAEKRTDNADGEAYTLAQFIEYYGDKKGNKIWEAAGKREQEPPVKAKAKAKAKAAVDLTALEKGDVLQAKADDDKWYLAKVVAVSRNRRVKINWVGYTSASDIWLGSESIRSKKLSGKKADVARVPKFYKLSSGHRMPALGLGTFKASKGEVGAAVTAALKAGYRLLDCAQGYGNQAEVGAAISEAIAGGVVKREELFVATKVFQTHHVWKGDTSRVEEMLETTLKDLQLEYLDLLLIHWPFAFEQKKLDFPLRLDDGTPNPKLVIEVEYLDTWKVFEGFVEAGKVKSIGVSNFTIEQLKYLRTNSKIPPAVNQVEVHPYLAQSDMKKFCDRARIAVMAYSPLGSATAKFPEKHGATLMNHDLIKEIAATLEKTPSQVLIRWSLQRGFISIPKSSNAERIAQNGDVLSWGLSKADVDRINSLDSGYRYFCSYLKRPDNDIMWHDGVVEHQPVV